MPTFEIEQYELHASTFRVNADNKAEAIAKLLAGKAHTVEQSHEFLQVADQYGFAVEDCPGIVEELKRLGVTGIKDVIPSVRGVEEV